MLLEDDRAWVFTTAQLHLAPRTEARVRCKLSMRGVDGMVELTKDRRQADSMAVGRSLVAAGEEVVTVLVADLNNKAHKIPAGVKLGICEGVERQVEQREGMESVVVGPLPEHLQDLAQRSATNLTKDEEKTRSTLAQYAGVFSRGNLGLGHTEMVKHSINTGDSRVTVRPSSTPCRGSHLQVERRYSGRSTHWRRRGWLSGVTVRSIQL